MYKVVVWSTGGVGKLAVQAVHNRPDMELVGVWAHDPAKIGVDAGEICGIGPIGVGTTGDASRLIGSRPDCVVYAASGPDLDAGAVPDLVAMLDAGINVVVVSVAGLVFPDGYVPAHRDRLAAAAARGGASLYASGIEPGFAGDQLPLTLLTLCHSVRSIRTQELFLYSGYPVTYVMQEVFGFGKPLDARPFMAIPGVQSGTWAPPIRMIAHAMGVEVDEIRETYQMAATPRRLEVASGVIEAGTVGAVRFETIGIVGGRDAIVIEHINRMAPDLAPEWPSHERDGVYRIEIDADPELCCELAVGPPDDVSHQGMVATTMRLVNAIPMVVEANPGLLSSLDLPLTVPRHAFDGFAPLVPDNRRRRD